MSIPTQARSPEFVAVNQRFLAYYRGKLAQGSPPRKTAIDPTEIGSLLENIVIYERHTADHFGIRLMGTRVVERIGQELTGSNVLTLVNYAEKHDLQRCLNRVLDEPCGHYSRVVDRYASGRQSVVEILRLPLVDDADSARFIISSTCEVASSGFGEKGARPILIAKPIEQAFFALA